MTTGNVIYGGKRCLGIPDDPSDRDIRRILDFMQESAHIRWITRNLKEPVYTTRLRWLDSYIISAKATTANNALPYVYNRCENPV